MSAPLTAAGEATVAELAARYKVSPGAVRTLLDAVIRGGGSMAQFSHPDLGGSGQWLRGGMTMVGDMFNSGLQSTVSGICSELSSQLAGGAVLMERPEHAVRGGSSAGSGGSTGFGTFGGDWWPAELGRPSSSGGQNDSAYAYFPSTRRLAIRRGGAITLYDTGDHQISGVQQQQGGRGSLEFSSQRGTFTVDSLQVADASGSGRPAASAERPTAEPVHQPAAEPAQQPATAAAPAERPAPATERPTPAAAQPAPAAPTPASSPAATLPAPARPQGGASTAAEIGSAIETLAALRDKGFLTEDEFSAKKTELLSRL